MAQRKQFYEYAIRPKNGVRQRNKPRAMKIQDTDDERFVVALEPRTNSELRTTPCVTDFRASAAHIPLSYTQAFSTPPSD
jgi:hypothetical protein